MAKRPFLPPISERSPVSIDSAVAHTSRVYDYLLGGTDNFAVDREVAEHAFAAYPGGTDGARADARANRRFLGRSVRYLSGEGVLQFLDIGTGIPTVGNTHAVAQAAAPAARVVYVDNDPIVLAHAHALLHTAEGRTAFIEGDFRKPDRILEKAADTLDLDQPVGLVLVGLLHVIPDDHEPHEKVRTLLAHLAPGSFLALTHMTAEIHPEMMDIVLERLDRSMRTTNPPAFRSRADIERFFEGLELIDPGVVHLDDWRPDPPTCGDGRSNGRTGDRERISPIYCGVARVPSG